MTGGERGGGREGGRMGNKKEMLRKGKGGMKNREAVLVLLLLPPVQPLPP